MIRILLRLFVTCAVLLSLLAGGALAFSWLGAEARGAVPLERLARRGSALERHVARMVADTLAAGPYTKDVRWSARREVSADGDTIRVWVYRREDAGTLGRMLRPEPWMVGGPYRVVSEGRLHKPGIAVR
ncbi:MAG TPA: hypothetical protein VF142_13780 [Longimicrobium sp.]